MLSGACLNEMLYNMNRVCLTEVWIAHGGDIVIKENLLQKSRSVLAVGNLVIVEIQL